MSSKQVIQLPASTRDNTGGGHAYLLGREELCQQRRNSATGAPSRRRPSRFAVRNAIRESSPNGIQAAPRATAISAGQRSLRSGRGCGSASSGQRQPPRSSRSKLHPASRTCARRPSAGSAGRTSRIICASIKSRDRRRCWQISFRARPPRS